MQRCQRRYEPAWEHSLLFKLVLAPFDLFEMGSIPLTG